MLIPHFEDLAMWMAQFLPPEIAKNIQFG